MTVRYRFDDVEIDLQGFRLTRAGKPIAQRNVRNKFAVVD